MKMAHMDQRSISTYFYLFYLRRCTRVLVRWLADFLRVYLAHNIEPATCATWKIVGIQCRRNRSWNTLVATARCLSPLLAGTINVIPTRQILSMLAQPTQQMNGPSQLRTLTIGHLLNSWPNLNFNQRSKYRFGRWPNCSRPVIYTVVDAAPLPRVPATVL